MTGPTALNIYFCGGSQLVAWGLPRTQAVPVLVTRELRAAAGDRVGRSHLVAYDGHPADLLRTMPAGMVDAPSIVVFVPRNVFIFGVESTPAGRTDLPGRLETLRMYLRHAALVLAMPIRVRSYAAGLDAVLARCRQGSAALIVLATPVPIARKRALHTRLYQAALARVVRSRVRGGIELADVYRRLREQSDEPLHVADDPGHLTVAGQRRVAETIAAAVLRSGVLAGGPGIPRIG